MTIDFVSHVRDDPKLMDFAMHASSIIRAEIGHHDRDIHVSWSEGSDPDSLLVLTLAVSEPGSETGAGAESESKSCRLDFSGHELEIGHNELQTKLLAKLRDRCSGLIRDSRRW